MINLVNISSGGILQFRLILIVFVAFYYGCSSEPHVMLSDYPNKGPISNDGYSAALATTDLKTGDNRFSFLLSSPEGFVSVENVALRIYQGGSKATPLEYVPDSFDGMVSLEEVMMIMLIFLTRVCGKLRLTSLIRAPVVPLGLFLKCRPLPHLRS